MDKADSTNSFDRVNSITIKKDFSQSFKEIEFLFANLYSQILLIEKKINQYKHLS